MPDDYQDSLDYLYGRLNYERLGMPRSPVASCGSAGCGGCSAGWATRTDGAADRPRRRDQGEGLDRRDDRRGAVRPRASGPACSARRTCTGSRSGSASTAASATPDELVALIDAVRPAVAALDAEPTPHAAHRGPTFFEITTAMGLLHFARRGAGAVVLEVGLGGRLDSTNVVRPVVSVITTISFDHTRQLGSTLAAIAREKAGILKRGRPAVSGVRGRRGPRRDPPDGPAAAVPAPRDRRRFLTTSTCPRSPR